MWFEFHTSDVDGALVAFKDLGFGCRPHDLADFGAAALLSNPEPCGVVLERMDANDLVGLVPFRSVESVPREVERMDGAILVPPLKLPGGTRVLLKQPDGSLFGLWERGREGTQEMHGLVDGRWALVVPRASGSEDWKEEDGVFEHPCGLLVVDASVAR